MRPGSDSFFDELLKIATAGDLMTPAVVSDSATVDGPPAAPFVKRKHFKRLEQTFPKEAGLAKDFLTWAKVKTKKVGESANTASLKAYTKLPRPVQKAMTDPVTMDPSDARFGAAAQTIKHILKIGSEQERE